MDKSESIEVGIFGSPFGLKGEIKVNFFTTSFVVFKNLKEYINEKNSIKWKFKNITLRNNYCIVNIVGCDSRNQAEKLKGIKIFSYKKFLPVIKNNQYYVNDLKKCNIFFSNGNLIGKVINVDNFGAGDLLETNFNNKNIYIPMNKENLISINLKKKEIIVEPIKGIIDSC